MGNQYDDMEAIRKNRIKAENKRKEIFPTEAP
jgi:hypothetical protein